MFFRTGGMPSLLALPGTPMAGTPTGVRFGVTPARRLLFPLGHRGGPFRGGATARHKKAPRRRRPRRDKEV
ncbi:hypothetical protein, secreted [Salinibacter ruber M8]|uniref:Uncharacterized protein n=1 Tax=Salinibacter ruber (strain M8) TaxID=761659 RepID=D5HBP2_SALRM|nr:hypothetical protein, secreted [Salinibacter ruber M8]